MRPGPNAVVAPGGLGRRGDPAFRALLGISSIAASVLLLAVFVSLVAAARPALVHNGLRFLAGSTWDPVAGVYGALPFLVGTLLTSLIALAIASVFSLALAVLLGEYVTRGPLSTAIRSMVELLAGVPSVVYGFAGLALLVPVMRQVEMLLGAPPIGVSVLTAAILLAVMILPYATSMAREVIAMVPADLREAALSLGATRSETVRRVIVPHAASGIAGGMLLALGRALGETMAVTMVIGNSTNLSLNVFLPGNTMASVIANEFSEATGELYIGSLVEIALLLLVVSTALNVAGRAVIRRMAAGVQS
jgi:phosphate transport system permease protein